MNEILSSFIKEEEKKYKIMSSFSIYFVSLGNNLEGKEEEIKNKIEQIKKTSMAISQIIIQQKNRLKQYSKINEKLLQQKEIISQIISTIELMEKSSYYENKEELTKIHARIEAFDVFTKQARIEAQLILAATQEIENKRAA